MCHRPGTIISIGGAHRQRRRLLHQYEALTPRGLSPHANIELIASVLSGMRFLPNNACGSYDLPNPLLALLHSGWQGLGPVHYTYITTVTQL